MIMNEDIRNEKEKEEHSELTTDLQEMTSADIPVEVNENTAEEIDQAADIITKLVARIREENNSMS